jgi:nitronate monooxygenase
VVQVASPGGGSWQGERDRRPTAAPVHAAPEARIHPAWADALARTLPEGTMVTRAFSGRAGRGIATAYVRAAAGADAPQPAPYPVQRALTAAMRQDAQRLGDVERMQAWAGQAAALARAEPAAAIVGRVWSGARRLLGGAP